MKTCIFILAMALMVVTAACVKNDSGRDAGMPISDRIPSMEFIKAVVRHNEEVVSTLKADWTVEYQYLEAFKELNPEYWGQMDDAQLVLAQQRGRIVRDSTGRYRLEMTTEFTSGRLRESVCGYDGSAFKWYDVMPKEPAYGQNGRISAKTQQVPLLSPDRLAGYWIDWMRLSEYLEKSKMKEIRETTDSADRRFVEVDTIHFADANVMVRFRLDPEKGYCVTAIDTYMVNPPARPFSTIETTELREIRKGTWFPTEGVLKLFEWVDAQHKALETISQHLKVKSLQAGFTPKDDMFYISFPKGTSVLNEMDGTSYRIGVAPEHP
jgi:hypothetical protein